MEFLARVPGMMLGLRRVDGHAADGIGDGAGVGTVLSGAAAGMGGMGIVCMGMVGHGFPPIPADLGLYILSRSRACFHNSNTRVPAGDVTGGVLGKHMLLLLDFVYGRVFLKQN